MKLLDRYGETLSVGDPVVFTSSGDLCRGYVYKMTNDKVYMTYQPKGRKPFPDGHKVCNVRMLENISFANDPHQVKGFSSSFIIKL